MDTRAILPVLAQYTTLFVPVAVIALILIAGVATRQLASVYNKYVTDQHLRSVVSTIVKEAEMTLQGGPEKKDWTLNKLLDLVPGMTRQDGSRLIEAAVFDLNLFDSLTKGAMPAAAGLPITAAASGGKQQFEVTHIIAPPPTGTQAVLGNTAILGGPAITEIPPAPLG